MPGSPLPYLRPDNPPWRPLREGFEAAARALAEHEPDVLLVYSTRWIAVLDALWQTRARLTGVHVDEVWHEHGELPLDIRVDRELAEACVAATNEIGVRAKGVDYEAFPIDTGTVVASALLSGGREPLPLVIAANNIYHGPETTERLGALAVRVAEEKGRRAAVIAVGGLSRGFFDRDVEPSDDHISLPEHDELNRRLLDLLAAGDDEAVRAFLPEYAERAHGDQHMKHLWWLLGALGGLGGATVHAYGPDYGSGAAVVELQPSPIRDAVVVEGAVAEPDTGLDGASEPPAPSAPAGPAVWRAAPPRRARRTAGRSWSRPIR